MILPPTDAPAGTRAAVAPGVVAMLGVPPRSYWLRVERHWILVRPRTRRERLRELADDLWWGLAFGYPACCVLRYAFGGLDDEATQGSRRGCRRTKGGEVYVPCGVFHRRQGSCP